MECGVVGTMGEPSDLPGSSLETRRAAGRVTGETKLVIRYNLHPLSQIGGLGEPQDPGSTHTLGRFFDRVRRTRGRVGEVCERRGREDETVAETREKVPSFRGRSGVS